MRAGGFQRRLPFAIEFALIHAGLAHLLPGDRVPGGFPVAAALVGEGIALVNAPGRARDAHA